ncbi:FecR family protein [Paraglaciecola chathamensis]|uniref:FecR family protein n=1 Tax=Paraglaciecola chathamensis TaxID=368405 RepID=UPI0026FC6462|nr:FecR domain-containing protein [Paraglaciecola chathamensis]MDO6560762.1 FecR domain-containing protein [Paraglaciecola chathamensis]
MGNIHILNTQHLSSEQALDSACDWIARIDRGLTESEKTDFQEWLHERPDNLSYILKAAKMWDKMDDLERLADIFPKSHVNKRRAPIAWGALAASLLLMLMLSLYHFSDDFLQQNNLVQTRAIESTYQTSVGEIDTITLPDGSVLALNTNTIVGMKYTNSVRVLELTKGEINIDVAHDASRPLSVLVNGKVIQAVGTVFNIEARGNLTELIVTDGKVLVEDKSTNQYKSDIANKKINLPITSLAVSRGEKIDLRKNMTEGASENIIKLSPEEIISSLAWQDKKLIFRGEKLSHAIAEINRYTDTKLSLDNNESLKNINVIGVFKTGEIVDLLDQFKKNFKIQYTKKNKNEITLYLPS